MMKHSKKKHWRKIHTPLEKSKLIRKVCYSILVLELAFFLREKSNSWILIKEDTSIILEPAGGGEDETYRRIHGFRIRLKEGLVDFYQKEEFSKIH